MNFTAVWVSFRARLREYRAQLRYCLRLTLAGLLAFGLAQFWDFPLHGLWAVLSAVVVTQMSIGGSLQATTEYVVGTLCGAIYASAVAVLVPHATMPSLVAALALSIAPLALLAAFNSKFRVAPFTAVLVLFISSEFRQSPLESATYRVLEVMLGGGSAILVSVLILPERAHARALAAAARILERFADVLPALLGGLIQALDIDALHGLQDDLGTAVTGLLTIVGEVKRERLTAFTAEPDHAALSRTILRLRHDLVILGRAAAAPLPEPFAKRLAPLLMRVGATTGDDLRACAAALVSRGPPPPLESVDAVYEAYGHEFAALREEGLTRALDAQVVERVFALGFSLEQLHRDLMDLRRRVSEVTRAPKVKGVRKGEG